MAQRPARKVAVGAGNRVTGDGPPSPSPPALREWDRATTLLSTFAVTGHLTERSPQGDLLPVRPSSVLLVGSPGSGKTEIIERFKRNPWLSYHNDLTVKSLLPLLRRAETRRLTHIAAPEFNKWFQRKSSIAENCIGLLSQAMEEGVSNYTVGPLDIRFSPAARLGIFGGMTPGTLSRRRSLLDEMGFLSRASVIPWLLPPNEIQQIMHHINAGITKDLEPVDLPVPEAKRTTIAWDNALGADVMEYVNVNWGRNAIRVFKRFKTLLLARAYLSGMESVRRQHWDWLVSYDDYWQRMDIGGD